MDCKDAQRRFNAYLDGELPAETSALVHEHLRECPRCSEELGRHRALQRLMDGLPGMTVPQGFASSVRARAARRLSTVGQPILVAPRRPAPILARLAAVLVVAVGVMLGGLMSSSIAHLQAEALIRAEQQSRLDMTLDVLGAVPPDSVAETYLALLGQAR